MVLLSKDLSFKTTFCTVWIFVGKLQFEEFVVAPCFCCGETAGINSLVTNTH